MTDMQLYHQLALLPESLKGEVKTFIEFLQHKEKQKKNIKKRKFGCAKGKIKILPGFDEPLEDFKDYM
ncbi:MAG: DUF2281 domain-containing protein [Lewinellaceae bacterium]|nr:DUF2281 domain-containing protein [Saprospiraceae bacterium]MCB9341070.1 DUF2281 domain-containing protein [Lewinellaceae bacterium]